jgi:hypothetical protein
MKGCKSYVVITMNKKDDIVNVVQHPILLEFPDMFIEYLLGIPPKKELEFMIEVKPRPNYNLKAPYHITTPKLREI